MRTMVYFLFVASLFHCECRRKRARAAAAAAAAAAQQRGRRRRVGRPGADQCHAAEAAHVSGAREAALLLPGAPQSLQAIL